MEIQAKFQAAFGGSPRQIPKKKEILDFLRNEELATLSNAMEFADCMEFVAYSNQRKVFVARPPWTPCKLRLERWGEIFLYSVSAAICIGLIAAPAFDPNRLWLIFPTAFYAVLKATLGAQVRRAQKLLRKKVTRGTSPGVPPEQVPPTGSPNSR
jgi:hypothetical protein